MRQFGHLARWRIKVEWWLFRILELAGIPIAVNGKLVWKILHQRFELTYHQHRNYRWDDQAFQHRWSEIFGRFLDLRADSFTTDHVILDIGCGSRPAFDWFESGCQKYYLDPLLERYLDILQVKGSWTDKAPDELIGQPAEVFNPSLERRCDFVNCWNVLDHTYDWKQILENIGRYAKPGALVCIGTDLDTHGPGHPGIDDHDFFFEFIESHFVVKKRQPGYAGRDIAFKLVRK